ncbi:hypothetical protein [Cyanobium sp. NS01]|uniref:hypothetical protein n=1 Tax=Cyanobium sp. NS01 TaxID=261284 RepID=UPI0016456C31|nr:hypothetical protein [Cyanobium sp. NS01]QNI71975.1 hypothetical protein CyaNS01_02881 [Cyanobium sp. NS01]
MFHASTSATTELWLPTGQAARQLAVSNDTLKRYASRDEFLIEGKHWQRGAHPNSPWTWNVHACRKAMSWRNRHGKRPPNSEA